MDLKATALLKLVYLEMFGHDMSWASFHVLEVMSSPKYHQKRVGYLGAVQSFRPDTEVLMLATNLLKKDVSSPLPPTISLPLITLPHIITSSLALSLLSDLLPRLSHSKPSIRKKTVVALYRLALVYPETLRPAWPRIKDLLMDEQEDSSVTAAVINVVCELGWRRPRDFLPLAPRLFELLVAGDNNWMAIKIIKLFATLTPLEPRLIKKLLPPLTNLIRTTPAMSLLYECINGIIQGGILEGTEGVREGDEIATLCVAKLREMIIVEGDPNLRYVALLAFNKIVASHAYLVSLHQDVIMSCIDDPDISIRLQALELGAGMVDSENLTTVVERLLKQLRNAPLSANTVGSAPIRPVEIEPAADSEGEDPEEILQPQKDNIDDSPALPTEYRIVIIRQILDMCSKNTYANVTDFEWYIEILVQLVRLAPSPEKPSIGVQDGNSQNVQERGKPAEEDIACAIGWELRNVAVRVSSVRAEAVNAAAALIDIRGGDVSFPSIGSGGHGALGFAAWIVGEFANRLRDVHETLNTLIHPRVRSLPDSIITAYLQAVPKVLVSIVMHEGSSWNVERKTMMALLLAKILHFLEPLTTNPSLDVQERSVELAELMKVAAQAVNDHGSDIDHGPILLVKVIPSLFTGSDLNPVAPTAQKKVPLPDDLNLDTPLNQNLSSLLQLVDSDISAGLEHAEFEQFYNHRGVHKPENKPALDLLPFVEPVTSSYQQTEDASIDLEAHFRKQKERRSRNKDDPFYIASDEGTSGTSTPFHEILKNNNGGSVDVDSIPIMALDLGEKGQEFTTPGLDIPKPKRTHLQPYIIADDENVEWEDSATDQRGSSAGSFNRDTVPSTRKHQRVKKSLLEVDSSGLGSYSMHDSELNMGQLDIERQEAEDADMAKALKEVERLRLEMQRASERIQASNDIPPEGTLVRKKKKKKRNPGKGSEDTTVAGIESQGLDSSNIASQSKSKKKRKSTTLSMHNLTANSP
ncbi:AP-3 complex subunit delta [Pseudocyphellaria aurata]|nr:AP-3 complex subunit delta [Pseudocyphellaria aurata]